MLTSRFPNGCFPVFCHFRMEKKGFARREQNIVWFPIFLMHIRPFDLISIYKKTNLTWSLHVPIRDNKNTRRRYETCLKLKLKNKYTRMTLSDDVLLRLLLNFLPSWCVFIVDFEDLNDGWEFFVCILTMAIQVTINSSKSLTRTRLFLL